MTKDIFKKQLESKRLADLTHQELHLDDNHNLLPDNRAELNLEVSNGGCGHSKNVASIMHRFFRHRSKSETYFSEACHQRGVLYSPLMVIARRYHRIEVDFIIFHLGSIFILELDGPHHKFLSKQEEYLRIKPLLDSGFEVHRKRIPPIMSLKFANDLLDQILEKMEQAA